jgi:hypothetical protein
LFGILSAGLLLGGLASPVLGRSLDRFGSARVMTWGSLVMALLICLLALAPNIVVFGGLTILIELLSFTILYDAAFALLAQKRPTDTRTAITRLTLIAGFASTIFWPLSGWLVAELGWRGTYLSFAALHLVSAALHLRLARWPAMQSTDDPVAGTATARVRHPPLQGTVALRASQLLALSFGLTAMAISAVTVHLVQILQARDLGEMAYVTAMVLGPAQVAARVLDATVWRDHHPLVIALVSGAAIPAALFLLLVPGASLALAIAFAAVFGAGAGLGSIVRGAVPVALFGTADLGSRLGRLAAVRSVMGAAAPFLFAWAAVAWSTDAAVAISGGLGVAGLVTLAVLYRWLRRIDAVPPLRRAG